MITKTLLITTWILQCIAAAILLQTLCFKFTGAEESRYIFSRLGMEPWGRWCSGALELVAVVLLLHPRTAAIGALLAIGVISGAIMSRLTKLGIVVKNDGGLFFILGVVVFVTSAGVLAIRRFQIPLIGPRLAAVSHS